MQRMIQMSIADSNTCIPLTTEFRDRGWIERQWDGGRAVCLRSGWSCNTREGRRSQYWRRSSEHVRAVVSVFREVPNRKSQLCEVKTELVGLNGTSRMRGSTAASDHEHQPAGSTGESKVNRDRGDLNLDQASSEIGPRQVAAGRSQLSEPMS